SDELAAGCLGGSRLRDQTIGVHHRPETDRGHAPRAGIALRALLARSAWVAFRGRCAGLASGTLRAGRAAWTGSAGHSAWPPARPGVAGCQASADGDHED